MLHRTTRVTICLGGAYTLTGVVALRAVLFRVNAPADPACQDEDLSIRPIGRKLLRRRGLRAVKAAEVEPGLVAPPLLNMKAVGKTPSGSQ